MAGHKALRVLALFAAIGLGFSALQNLSDVFSMVSSSSEVAYAEQILQEKLMSPTSYRRLDGEVVWSGKDDEGNDAFVVKLGYDSQNGFGAMLRGCSFVSYIVKGESLSWSKVFGIQSCDTGGAMNERQYVELLVETNFHG